MYHFVDDTSKLKSLSGSNIDIFSCLAICHLVHSDNSFRYLILQKYPLYYSHIGSHEGNSKKPKNIQELKRGISYWEREERNEGISKQFYVQSEVGHVFDKDCVVIEIWQCSSKYVYNIVSRFSVWPQNMK